MPVLLDTTRRAIRNRRTAHRTAPIQVVDLLNLVRAVADTPRAWQPLLQLPDGATRWWTQLHADRRFDLWLLSWLPGHSTELHDHGGSAAAFAVVHGALSEVRVEPGGVLSTQVRYAGSATSMAPGVIHDVTGFGAGPAVSIHAYSPPLRQMSYYVRDDQGRPRLARTVPTTEPEQELAS